MVKARTLWPGVESPPAPTGQGAEHPVYPCQSNCISSPDCHLLNDPSNKHVPIVEVAVKVRGTREFGESRVASNLFRYGYQTIKIILNSFRDYRPFGLCFFLSAMIGLPGLCLSAFFISHYALTGEFTPHKWAGFSAFALLFFAFLILGLGFILDMFARMRLNQEEILYNLKRLGFEGKAGESN